MDPRPPNRLATETSPYLLQHSRNPVDWWPWCPEALAEAARRDVPVLLSIGYAACHWCHVMERESFEDPVIAGRMNRDFVCIKVDREERPDLDQIYQAVVQLLTHHGGWPLTAFLQPDGQPFFAGTYFPPAPRYGMPSFSQLLDRVHDVWTREREGIEHNAAQLREALRSIQEVSAGGELPADLLDQAASELAGQIDTRMGGFGRQPKFPNPLGLDLLQRRGARPGGGGMAGMVELTLREMARGGIYDHLGGGFHRYSTDERWLVPHFEKMLYDNALLPRVYLQAWLAGGQPEHARVVRETLDYLVRELRDPRGGFHSSTDADSEGVEGLYFLWTPEEVGRALGDGLEARALCAAYEVNATGHLEGRSILHRRRDLPGVARELSVTEDQLATALARARARLLEVRATRVPPLCDDKVLAAWNGLTIATLARCGACMEEPAWIQAAVEAADFVWNEMRDTGGHLLRSHRGHPSAIGGYLDDLACLAEGSLELFLAAGRPADLTRASSLVDDAFARFADEDGGFYLTSAQAEPLVQRPRSLHDQAAPSGVGVLARTVVRLHALTGDDHFAARADRTLRRHRDEMVRNPFGTASLISAADAYLCGPQAVVVVGEAGDPGVQTLLRAARRHPDPDLMVLHAIPSAAADPGGLGGILRGRPAVDGAATAYRCRGATCSLPVQSPGALIELLRS